MKKIFLLAGALLVFVSVNYNIAHKEIVLNNGKTMLLRLAPRDPRSLMQGDYMVLRYTIAGSVPEEKLENKGCIIVTLDDNQVAQFLRMDDNTPLGEGEYRLFYRKRDGIRLGAESFFFQEGDARKYSNAWYGELKVDKSGASILTGLRGEDFSVL